MGSVPAPGVPRLLQTVKRSLDAPACPTLAKRSTIALDGELVARLSNLAEKKRVSRYSLANECISTMARVVEEGGAIDDLYGSWRIMRLSREVGGFPLIPRNLIDGMASKLLAIDKDWLLKAWYEEGVTFGGILKLRFQDPSALGAEVLRLFPSSSRRLDIQKRTAGREKHIRSTSWQISAKISCYVLNNSYKGCFPSSE